MRNLILTIVVTISSISFAHGQILISILLGDKLNSENLEFGLVGGAAFTNISQIPEANTSMRLHLGFYFDIVLNDPLSLYTGVIVKSSLGAEGLAPYAVGDDALDQLLSAGSVERKLSYFNVPVLLKYRVYNYFFVEGGLQMGLLYKAKDEFSVSLKDEDDLVYTNDIENQFKKLDFGVTGGLGYQLMQGNGVSLGIRYYAGVVDILKDGAGDAHHNAAFYLFAGIPIGGVKDKDASGE